MSTIESLERLREWADVSWEPWAESRERLHRMLDEIEAEVEERYTLLPLDADGVPIRVGDVLESDISGEKRVWMVSADGFAVYGDCSGYNPKAFRHVKSRTLEDVLTEMLDRNTDGVGLREFNRDFGAFVAHYAEEIRELLGVEVDDD